MLTTLQNAIRQIGGAFVFYTCIPLPSTWSLDFTRIARWAPLIGLGLGVILGGIDLLLTWTSLPLQPRSALVIALWVALTGGLHVDGVMDVADGLAVPDRDRRLTVMTDSRSGAFAGMAVVLLLGIKICALLSIPTHRELVLVTATTWGRWGQVIAIAQYPYLKPTGKGAFHPQNWQGPQDFLPGLLALIALGISQYLLHLDWLTIASISICGSLLTAAVAAWFNHQLGGMTGDVYGAIVEWSEAFLLCCLAAIWTIQVPPFT